MSINMPAFVISNTVTSINRISISKINEKEKNLEGRKQSIPSGTVGTQSEIH
jgi:hypothetical protein